MQVGKYGNSKSSSHLNNLLSSVEKQKKRASEKLSFAEIINRKLVITKYPQSKITPTNKVIIKTIKDNKKSQVKILGHKEYHSSHQSEKKRPENDDQVLKSRPLKLLLMKKTKVQGKTYQALSKSKQFQRHQSAAHPKQKLFPLMKPKHDLQQQIKNDQIIIQKKRNNSINYEKDIKINNEEIEGWESTVPCRNLQSRQPYYDMDANEEDISNFY